MIAVLQAVVDDCQHYPRAPIYRARVDGRTYLQATAYVASRDRTWPFSFENLCEAIGLDVGALREELARRSPGTRCAARRNRGSGRHLPNAPSPR
jgi:hypothetical protein